MVDKIMCGSHGDSFSSPSSGSLAACASKNAIGRGIRYNKAISQQTAPFLYSSNFPLLTLKQLFFLLNIAKAIALIKWSTGRDTLQVECRRRHDEQQAPVLNSRLPTDWVNLQNGK